MSAFVPLRDFSPRIDHFQCPPPERPLGAQGANGAVWATAGHSSTGDEKRKNTTKGAPCLHKVTLSNQSAANRAQLG